MRTWGGLALALVLGLALPGAARAAVACPDLVKAIDAALEKSRPQLGASQEPPMGGELEGLWDPVAFPFPGLDVYQGQFACWQARKGRPVDAATRLAVLRASRLLLKKRDNEAEAHGENLFFWIEDGLLLERATGVSGPISAELKARKLQPYKEDLLRENRTRRNFDGAQWEGSNSAYFTTLMVAELTALCLAHPEGFRSFVLSLGYEPSLLNMKPSRRIEADEPDPAQAAFLDAEYGRLVADCPT